MEKQAGVAARRQTAAFIGLDCRESYGGALPRRRYDRFFSWNPVHPVKKSCQKNVFGERLCR
jgi:hypothetical protein